MRHGASGRRGRNRGGGHRNNRGGGNVRAQVFDSNGPEVRIRGTAYQIQEKYAALAKDAAAAGDYVLSESYLQHAEHYQRIINSWVEQFGEQPRAYDPQQAQQPVSGNVRTDDDLALPSSILGGPVKAEGALEEA
jgi:hypothetical protein